MTGRVIYSPPQGDGGDQQDKGGSQAEPPVLLGDGLQFQAEDLANGQQGKHAEDDLGCPVHCKGVHGIIAGGQPGAEYSDGEEGIGEEEGELAVQLAPQHDGGQRQLQGRTNEGGDDGESMHER